MIKSKCIQGFTFVELVITVAVIAILAAVAIPKFADLVRKSKDAAIHGELGTIRSAIAIYYSENEGMFPSGPLSDALTNGGKYLDEISYCDVPQYHGKQLGVNDNDSHGLAGLDNIDEGKWCYHNRESDSGGSRQGDFWIGCVHTDTKGSIWSSY